jgi:hypothetical protein
VQAKAILTVAGACGYRRFLRAIIKHLRFVVQKPLDQRIKNGISPVGFKQSLYILPSPVFIFF